MIIYIALRHFVAATFGVVVGLDFCCTTSLTRHWPNVYLDSPDPAYIVRSQQLDHADNPAVNSRLLVLRQKMHGSHGCCGTTVELTVDDVWRITDAGDRELWRL